MTRIRRPLIVLAFISFCTTAPAFQWASEPSDDDREPDAGVARTGMINVKSPPFNAAGDGVADDTQAIQAAWNAARETGGRVLLPPGEYRISLRGDADDIIDAGENNEVHWPGGPARPNGSSGKDNLP